MHHFETESFSVHYTDTECGEAVVLLHAGGASAQHWRKITPYLQDRYRLLAPDLLGFGATKFRNRRQDASHDDQADLVRALIKHAGQGMVHVVGHSYGGATAMRLAVRYPEVVQSLVLIEPALTPILCHAGENTLYEESHIEALAFIRDADTGRDVAAWRRFIDNYNGDGTWASLSDRAQTRLLNVTAPMAAAYKANLHNSTGLRDLAELTIPTLVLCGEKTNEAYHRICGIVWEQVPDCDYEMISGAAHMSPLTHVESVVGAIEEHLDTHRLTSVSTLTFRSLDVNLHH